MGLTRYPSHFRRAGIGLTLTILRLPQLFLSGGLASRARSGRRPARHSFVVFICIRINDSSSGLIRINPNLSKLFSRVSSFSFFLRFSSQEGWHLELGADASAPLTYKGVVFNEMKGVYSSPDQVR